MTAEQLRALAGVCDALAELDRVDLPLVEVVGDRTVPLLDLQVGELNLSGGGGRWRASSIRVVHTGFTDTQWVVRQA